MKTFKVPDLGEGLQEVELISWNVAPGDNVVEDQPLVSVETEKAVVEIPAPRSGRIAQLYGAPGDILKVGSALISFEDDVTDAGTLVGSIPDEESSSTKRTKKAKSAPARKERVVATGSGTVQATPRVKMRATELGIDLSTVRGTGPNGSITLSDVESASAGPEEGYEPLRGVRRTMAKHMARAQTEVAATGLTDLANINAWHHKGRFMVRLIRAVVEACKAEPALNAWYNREARRLNAHVNLGIAVDTPDGLFVPTLFGIESMDEEGIYKALEVVKKDVKDRSIPPEKLMGQTITLSNYGTIAGIHGSMMVNPPQVAIVGAGRIHQQVLASNGVAGVRWVIPLSLTFDHRACTGGEAARFMRTLIDDLEKDQ